MKRKYAIIAVLSMLTSVTGCKNDKPVDQQGANVFPFSTVEDKITMGDVMPFYDNGVMNIYHLKNISGTNSLFYHPISRLTTSDYIHYTDEGVALNYEEKIDSVDAALGTGSFIKDEQGNYHCFYTGHNAATDKLDEVIRHAVSTDNQQTWVKDEEFNLYGWENDFRDPYVYYDKVDSTYYMLITTRDYAVPEGLSPAVIKRYKASSLNAKDSEWEYVDNFFNNDEGDYNMECPSYIELNGYYYLAYSEQGDNRVTHYRYRTSHDGEWKKFERDAIDSAGFYAGRLEKAEDKLFAFAWCARLTGGNSGGFDWAGNLVTHEIKQDPTTGELHAVMPQTYKDYFKNEIKYKTVDGNKLDEFTFDKDSFKAVGIEKLSRNVTRMSMKVSTSGEGRDFGITFGIDGNYNNRLGSTAISFDLENNKIVCYNSVSSIIRYGTPLTSLAYTFESNKEYDVDVIIDGDVVSLYLNGEVAITARFLDMQNKNFAFYSNGADAKIQGVKIYE